MPRVIEARDGRSATLDETIAALADRDTGPDDPDRFAADAVLLRRLGNNADFLGDMIVAELAGHARNAETGNAYGPQVIMLHPPGTDRFFLRANIWPSRDEHAMRAGSGAAFAYDLPHDHNFDFLTIGYFGPGYWSDYYEFEYEQVAGWEGEPAGLRFVERSRLEPGKILHYRAHRDVHAQIPPDALSVTLNVMYASPAQGWFDQYAFDTARGCVGRIVNPGSSEAFLRIAVGMGGGEALDLAERFAQRHPSDRMRLCAYDALATAAADDTARDALWRRAEVSGSRLVTGEARARRTRLALRELLPPLKERSLPRRRSRLAG